MKNGTNNTKENKMNATERKAVLHRRAMRYGRTIAGALEWLDRHYTGITKDCMRWQMDCTPAECVATVELRHFYKTIIRTYGR